MKTQIQLETCRACDAALDPVRTQCSCGRPTARMSFAERAAYEVLQWRAYQERVAATN
jgi:hypothetical protein